MFKNLKLRGQIGLSFGLVLLILTVTSVLAITALQNSSENFRAYRQLAISSLLSGRVQANMLMASKAADNFLRNREESYLDVFNNRFTTALEFALEQQTTITDPQRQQLSRELLDNLNNYRTASEEVFALIAEQMDPLDRSKADVAQRIKLSIKNDQDTLGPIVQGKNIATIQALLVGSSTAFLLAIVIAVLIIRAVTKPVAELVQLVERVHRSGDLSQRPNIRRNHEIGVIATARLLPAPAGRSASSGGDPT